MVDLAGQESRERLPVAELVVLLSRGVSARRREWTRRAQIGLVQAMTSESLRCEPAVAAQWALAAAICRSARLSMPAAFWARVCRLCEAVCDAPEGGAAAGGQAGWLEPALIVDGQVHAPTWHGSAPRVRHRRDVTYDRDARAFVITELFAGSGRHEIEVCFAFGTAAARPGVSARGAERLADVAARAAWARGGFDVRRAVEIGPVTSPMAILVPFSNQGLDLQLRPTLRYCLRVSLPCVVTLAVVTLTEGAR